MKRILSIIVILFFISCSKKEVNNNDPAQVYERGLTAFQEEEYTSAIEIFKIIGLQFPATEYAEYAQFYIAECDFNLEKYILAAYDYNRLRRVYPSSKYSKEALFKAALCFYELSPPFDRDQDYTIKAIQQFQDFQYQYPGDSLTEEANKYIQILRNKLAKGFYQTAYLYRKMESPKSSLIYYQELLDKFDDTEFYEEAYFGKIETLIILRRYDEALGLINLYKRYFPEGKYIERMPVLESTAKERRELPEYSNN